MEKISVCLPVYNRADYIKECIDSILSQTFQDFELLIVDDGSTDATCDIIQSYKDKRIKLIKNRHDYIETLNMLLNEASGKYIARMDSDDIMMPERLEVEYTYMENHPEVDILGTGIRCFGDVEMDIPSYHVGNIGVKELLEGCCITNPTVMMRKSSINKIGLRYTNEYLYAEDFLFWAKAAEGGLRIRNIPDILLMYRCCSSQITTQHVKEQNVMSQEIRKRLCRYWKNKVDMIVSSPVNVKESTNTLTVVIPFYNEQEEVKNTLKSIRETVGQHVDIIVVNDASDDGYNYIEDIKDYDVSYICNDLNIGSSASKERGVRCCRTQYFLLLDAHMRFYQSDWVDRILMYLKQNDQQLLCCQTMVLKKENGIVYKKNDASPHGAYIYMGTRTLIPKAVWSYESSISMMDDSKIQCILGAGYASSVSYWKKIRGLEGLLAFGSEEAYLSLKAWLDGGGCRLMDDIVVGHIYKDSSPYSYLSATYLYNMLIIAEMLMPYTLKYRVFASAKIYAYSYYEKAKCLLESGLQSNSELNEYYKKMFCQRDFEYIRNLNFSVLQMSSHSFANLFSVFDILKDFCLQECKNDTGLGLYDGAIGKIIFLCWLYRYSKDVAIDDLASELLGKVCRNIDVDKLPMTFKNGFLGVGWGLMYLVDNGFLNYEDVSDELLEIDSMVQRISPDFSSELSLEYGTAGLLCYVVSRLGLCKRMGLDSNIRDEFIANLKEMSCRMENGIICNLKIREYTQFLLMANYGDENWNLMKLDLDDILDLPLSIPKNQNYWSGGLTGALGHALILLRIKSITL